MQISTNENKDTIIENSLKKKAIISTRNIKSDDYDIVVAPKFEGKGFFLNTPGEYELGQISVTAQATRESGKFDIVEFIVDNISVVSVSPGFKYLKRVHDVLGDVDILVYMDNTVEILKELIGKFDPEIVIGMNDCDESILKGAGVTNIDETNKLKVSSESFGTDSFIIKGVILK